MEEGKTTKKDRGGWVCASREILVLENFLKIYEHRLWRWVCGGGVEQQDFPTAPPQKAWRPAFEGPLAPPCSPAGCFRSRCRGLGLWLGEQCASAALGPRFHVLMNMHEGPPPPRPHGPRGTALRLWPAKAAGPAAKIVRRGSCTCLFWNRTGLSEFTKPGRQCRLQPSSGPAISHSLRAAPVHYERCPLRSCPPPVPFQAAGTLAVLLALWRRRPLQSPGPHPVTDPTPEVGGQGTKGFPIAHPLSLLWSRLECPLSLSVSFSPFSFLSPGSYSRLWLSPSPYPLMRGAISRLLERLL